MYGPFIWAGMVEVVFLLFYWYEWLWVLCIIVDLHVCYFCFRLEACERNQNFQGEVIALPDVIITNWPDHGFQQLMPSHISILPKLTESHIRAYFKYRLASDNPPRDDIKAIQKGKMLLSSLRIDAYSLQKSLNEYRRATFLVWKSNKQCIWNILCQWDLFT